MCPGLGADGSTGKAGVVFCDLKIIIKYHIHKSTPAGITRNIANRAIKEVVKTAA
jgi:hypothetical protein